MTYQDMSDQDVISLLEGKTLNQVLGAMSSSTETGDYRDIDDIYLEIIEMSTN